MSRLLTTVIAAVLIAGFIATVPTVMSQAPASAGTVSFYLDQQTLSTTPPTAPDSQKRALVPTASTPAATVNPSEVAWTGFKVPADLTMTGEATISFYLTAKDSTAPAVWNNMRAIVKKGTTTVGEKSRGNYFDSNTAAGPNAGPLGNNVLSPGEVLRVDFAIGVKGVEFEAGDELGVALILWGVGHPSTPVEAAALYGSIAHPSRLTVGVSAPGSLPLSGGEQRLFLDDAALSPVEPTDAVSKKRVTGSTGQGVAPAAAAAASEFSWGKFKAESDIVLTSDSYLETWVTWDGDAGAMRGLRGFLYIDGVQAAFNDIGLTPTAYPTPPSTTIQTTRVLFGFGSAGKVVPAGKDVEIRFITWAPSGAPPGNLVFLYGSTAHPSSLTLRVPGGAGAADSGPLVALTSEIASLAGAPGADVTAEVLVSNGGAAPVEVTLNATGDLVATFSSATVTIAPGNFSSVNVTFAIPDEAAEGDSFDMVVQGAVAGAEVSTVNFVVNVLAPGSPSSSSAAPTSSSSSETPPTSSSAATDNETGGLKTQEAAEPIPGPLGILVLVGLAAVAMVRRRKA